MSLNPQRGNMYPWVSHTWNPVKGRCPHECSYCYMKRFPLAKLWLDERCFRNGMGKGNTIFVGSGTDMFAEVVPSEWIDKTLDYCALFPENKYLFQSKNPERFMEFAGEFPHDTVLGTTIETTAHCYFSKAPTPLSRAAAMSRVQGFKKMVSIEPVMEFELERLVHWIQGIKPVFVSVGADSKGSGLPEPSAEKVRELIDALNAFTEVRVKPNLGRILNA